MVAANASTPFARAKFTCGYPCLAMDGSVAKLSHDMRDNRGS